MPKGWGSDKTNSCTQLSGSFRHLENGESKVINISDFYWLLTDKRNGSVDKVELSVLRDSATISLVGGKELHLREKFEGDQFSCHNGHLVLSPYSEFSSNGGVSTSVSKTIELYPDGDTGVLVNVHRTEAGLVFLIPAYFKENQWYRLR
ncbi:hypothetical protein [Corallincola spongiicola]|uniref:Uncharacterized protein n=1 Tax=Corallincola spongiicola TaxID=2520508 RepID=A0ABY1WTP7_9GAMM|nr:hypothetical protein [Corallincola spongiicola]TAA48116.1 hypothetical protein EXY25_02425 [Corallincola spongiicola]